MELVQRQAMALRHQQETLQEEFNHWRGRTQAGQPLEKHHTQIARITAQLEGLLARVELPADLSAATFTGNAQAQRLLLNAHRLWDYFRTKLALRDVAWFRQELLCADELAWACYRPARAQAESTGVIAAASLKEPPLVFYSPLASPFVQGRETLFDPEGLTQEDLRLLGVAVLKLPIPVIGLPWFQVNHLPAGMAIAHEAGHAVERDFGLVAAVDAAMAGLEGEGVAAARVPAWQAWAREVFADLYGVLCCGEAYVLGLMDYLLAETQVIEGERRQPDAWEKYPTRHLRVLINLAALDALGLDGAGVGAGWRALYQAHAMAEFEPDVPKVVAALLAVPLGGKPLRQVVAFSPANAQAAAIQQANILGGFTLNQGEDFRILFAAAALAYHADPEQYRQRNAQRAIVEQMAAAVPPGVRSAGPADPAALAPADAQAGAALADLFME
ncbi:MAG TPA: hypothetical protein VNK95_20435 [Caldilineaceae bacterium]|nr:hypothetical protein [Caldilineaceae bacterium]